MILKIFGIKYLLLLKVYVIFQGTNLRENCQLMSVRFSIQIVVQIKVDLISELLTSKFQFT